MSNPPGSRPALTESEWANGYDSRDLTLRLKSPGLDGSRRLSVNVHGHPLGGSMGDQQDMHALAALCLYEQPFGFTAADVQNLLAFAGEAEFATPNVAPDEIARSLASRIRALLPPPPP